MPTRKYDVIVAGGGTGRDIVLAAEAQSLKVALPESGQSPWDSIAAPLVPRRHRLPTVPRALLPPRSQHQS